MPDRGDERGRGGTRTLVTGILAGTEWHPATNPQEATQTAREARDLAVRLRPVLSKLAQAPRGGRRRDLEWLPAVEQLAVDAQYFASWWLPRLEGKSAQSWPSWSADGYADWVKRLDAQRLRTLEMVEGTAPVTRIASVTQLRRGKNTTAEPDVEEQPPAAGVDDHSEAHSPASPTREDSEPTEDAEEKRTARITPLRGPGAALMDAALMDVTGASADADADDDISAISEGSAESTAPTTPQVVAKTTETKPPSTDDALPPVPRTPPNQGPVDEDPASPRITIAPDASAPSDAPSRPVVPRTPPNQGPADDDSGAGADILQIPRTPPNSAPPRKARSPIVSLVGESDRPRVPRTPPNPGPAEGGLAADAGADTRDSLTPAGPAALEAGTPASGALETGADDRTRPLFRSTPSAPAAAALAGAGAAGSGAPAADRPGSGTASPGSAGAASAGAASARAGSATTVAPAPSSPSSSSSTVGLFGTGSPSHEDEFERFEPGSDLPPPIFPMTEPTEPVDRGRIVRFAAAAVALAAGGVLVFVAVTQKGSDKTAATPPSTSSASSTGPGITGSPSSSISGAVTAPTATDTPATTSTASKPAGPPSKPSLPPSTAPKTTEPSHTSAAPPPPPQTTSRQQPPQASGGVSSLSVSSLVPDQTGGYNYIAHIHVTTNGTGTVTVTVTFAGTSSSNSPGSTGAQSQSFTLSGKTSYDLTPEADVHGMCQPSSPYIDVVAGASGASSAVAYASSPC